MPSRSYGVRHIGALLLLGACGWAGVVLATILPTAWAPRWELDLELIAVTCVAGIARAMASRVYGRFRIAIDSMFYIAVHFVFGPVQAAWVILLLLTIDGAQRLSAGTGPVPAGQAPKRFSWAYLVFYGGMPAAVMLLGGLIFGHRPLEFLDDWTLAWHLPAFAGFFLATYYFLAGTSAWFLGTPPHRLWRNFFIPAMTAELTLVPLSLAMVMAYKHQGLGLFLLVGATGLVFNGIFRRMTDFARSLARKVEELSILNRVSRIIAHSQDRETLVQGLAKATLELVPEPSRFLIGFREEDDETITHEVFNGAGERVKRLVVGLDEGLSGWVMRNRQALILGDVATEYSLYVKDERHADPRLSSWLAVPLVVYDDVVGVMSIQSETPHAYTMEHLRVMTAIADQAAVAIENSRLYQLATIDGLTGLFVRRYFDQRLHEEWDRSRRYGNPFSLALFDLDRFKVLNDTYGHQIGDRALRAAARAVRTNMRSFDLAARYGGEEFAVILPRTNAQEATIVAERIRRDVERLKIELDDGTTVGITGSVGIAASDNSSASSADELFALADGALYEAKGAGRNRVVTANGTNDGRQQVAAVASNDAATRR